MISEGRAMGSNDLTRRRKILWSHTGRQVAIKREFADRVPRIYGRLGMLVDVMRTRARLDYAPEDAEDREQWDIPISWLILPGSMEYDPRQTLLFPGEGLT
jgi:hypothetical protein